MLEQNERKVRVLALDARHGLLEALYVTVGSLTASIVHPREVFYPAIVHRAAQILLVHNHPSGDAKPSQDDLAVTRRLVKAGDLLGIPLIDHIVVVPTGYVSIKQQSPAVLETSYTF